jgi:hypothetical protein
MPVNGKHNQSGQNVKICYYKSLESLGVVSVILFMVYFVAISVFLGIFSTFGVNFFLILIGIVLGIIGWLIYFYDLFKPFFLKEPSKLFWKCFFSREELKKDG